MSHLTTRDRKHSSSLFFSGQGTWTGPFYTVGDNPIDRDRPNKICPKTATPLRHQLGVLFHRAGSVFGISDKSVQKDKLMDEKGSIRRPVRRQSRVFLMRLSSSPGVNLHSHRKR